MIHDVVIAGAGPVGLFLACELRLAGVSVLVLEQQADPHSALKQLPFGLRGLSVPTIDALRRRGLLEEVKMSQREPAHWERQSRRPGGHFAGIAFFRDRIDSPASEPEDTGLAVSMAHLEAVLAARAEALGVEVRRGIALEAFDASAQAVTVRAGRAVYRARWLVGCDGGRSVVRKAGGFSFSGTDPEFTGYSVDVALRDPDLLQAGRHYTATGMYSFQPPGFVAMVDFDGGAAHRGAPLTADHVQAVLRRVTGTDATVTALHAATTWTDRAFQASAYRNGRVLLAGDAAHIHSPLGGQGLNLGIGDAMNLGWKLAAMIRGDAPAGLLDSYSDERIPIGAQVLDWSRAQVALMRPSRSSRALTAIIRDLIETRDGATYFARRVSGASLRYDLGDDHPLVGRGAPDLALADGTRLAAHATAGQGVMLDFGADRPLAPLAARWGRRIVYLASASTDERGLSALLIRPDGVVAWVAEGPPDQAAAAAAAARWFGEPEA